MDRFSFRSLPLRPVAPAGASAPERALEIVPLTIASGVSAGERSGGELQALLDGDYSTVEHVDNELRWQAIGGCPVPFRGSVMRVSSIAFEHHPPTTSFTLGHATTNRFVVSPAAGRAVQTAGHGHLRRHHGRRQRRPAHDQELRAVRGDQHGRDRALLFQ